MLSSFIIFLSNVRRSSWFQVVIPQIHLTTATGSDLSSLCCSLCAVSKNNLKFLNYSLSRFSFLFVCCTSWHSFISKYLSAFFWSRSLMFSTVSLLCFFFRLYNFKQILSHFSNPYVILVSLLIAFIVQEKRQHQKETTNNSTLFPSGLLRSPLFLFSNPIHWVKNGLK